MNDLAARALSQSAQSRPEQGRPEDPPSAPRGTDVGGLLKGLGLPAIAILLAAHPLGRRMIASMQKVAPKAMRTLEESRFPTFVTENRMRGAQAYVEPRYTPTADDLAALAVHPRAREVRRHDPFIEVAMPEKLAETVEGRVGDIAKTTPLKTLVHHELGHAVGGTESAMKAQGIPTKGDWIHGAVQQDLARTPSFGPELLTPMLKDFPDLPYMYANYRSSNTGPGSALGELLTEYIARVKSGLPREQNMIYGPYSGMGGPGIYRERMNKFMPELEFFSQQGTRGLPTPRETQPSLFSPTAWEMLQQALSRQPRR